MSLSPQEAEEAAKSLNKAMKGIGTDEARLIKEIVKRTNAQRQQIKKAYMTLFGKDLETDLKSEISGLFLTTVLALLEPIPHYEARMLREAMDGLGTNERVIIQTLCPKESNEIEVLREAYETLYKRNLDQDLFSEQGSVLGRIFRSIAGGGRPDKSVVDRLAGQADARALYDAGEGKFGTDESEFMRILCSRSFPQLAVMFDEYARYSKHDIESAIKSEMSGNLEKACLAIVRAAKNKEAYFAHELHEAMDGLGTNEQDLLRLLVSKSESNFEGIKQQYEELYGKSLHDAVKSEVSGDFEKILLELIGK